MKKILLLLLPLSLLLLPLSWIGYGAFLSNTVPKVEISETSTMAISQEKTLPFYELMSPLPSLESVQIVPKLEYKKGPPDRYIEKISLLLQKSPQSSKERIVYYGRRTRTDLGMALHFFPVEGNNREALFTLAAIHYSQTGDLPEFAKDANLFLLRPFLLEEAKKQLRGVERVTIMDQAGTPAFFFEYAPGNDGRARASALFTRRNSSYRMDYIGDRGFSVLDPITLFRKSFLIEKRSDAMEYLAKNLSEVHIEQNKVSSTSLNEIAWPILLLAANVSVDPSSVDSFFHFAGISALLYRSPSLDKADLETLDALRNNVLASEFYAKDVNPSARQTLEIGRLARFLTRNFE